MSETTPRGEGDAMVTLQHVPLLRGVPDATLARIAALAQRMTFDEGDTVYALGDDARELFFVVRGRVRFSMGVGDRKAASGSIMTTGDGFGWAALLENSPRRVATASCLEDSTLLAVDGRKILDVFESDTRSGFIVMRRLAENISRDLLSVLAT